MARHGIAAFATVVAIAAMPDDASRLDPELHAALVAKAAREMGCMDDDSIHRAIAWKLARFRLSTATSLAGHPTEAKARALTAMLQEAIRQMRVREREASIFVGAARDPKATQDESEEWLAKAHSKLLLALFMALTGESIARLAEEQVLVEGPARAVMPAHRYGCTRAELSRVEAHVLARMAELQQRTTPDDAGTP